MAEVEGSLSGFWLDNGLTYCLNIHPAETLSDVLATLRGPVAGVKSRLSSDGPFPVGLRISAAVMSELAEQDARTKLRQALCDADLVPISVNGFPYGPFHGTRVKEEVYLPDWRAPERLTYTKALTDLVAELAEPGQIVSLSTVPGAFKANGLGAEEIMAESMVDAAVHAAQVARKTGRSVALAIEPEPCCFLETIAETVEFFTAHLYAERAVTRMSDALQVDADTARDLLRRHLGVCYDVCHAAVEFEDPARSVEALHEAGIPIHKLQLSAALRIPMVTDGARKALEPFAEPTYLHQVVSQGPDGLRRLTDLAPAIARGAESDGEEWRIHFHVPVFLAEVKHFGTTQAFLRDIISLHKVRPISPHLEIETYTWNVLPAGMRGATIEDDVARELDWVRSELVC